LLGVVGLSAVGWTAGATPDELNDQQECQKQIQAETDRLVRRIETMVRLLAEAEKVQSDSLTDLKDAQARVERLLQDQKDLRNKTEGALRTRALPTLTKPQTDLAQKTAEVRQQTETTRPDAAKALEKANQAMEQSARDLKETRS
jgi:hypothetical protein